MRPISNRAEALFRPTECQIAFWRPDDLRTPKGGHSKRCVGQKSNECLSLPEHAVAELGSRGRSNRAEVELITSGEVRNRLETRQAEFD
jgi:hypothetical protein